jgi:hypothetical protein
MYFFIFLIKFYIIIIMKLNRMEIFLIFTLIVCISCKPFENSIENSNELMALIETDPNSLMSDEDSANSNELNSDPFVYLKNLNSRIKKQLDLDNQNYDDNLNEDQYDSDSVSDESENVKETTDMNSKIINSLSQDLNPTTSENENKRYLKIVLFIYFMYLF